MKTDRQNTFYFIAGEASGDLHGAELIKHLKKLNNKALFCGIGGNKMVAAGMHSLLPMKKISVMGFVEVVKRLPFFLKLLNDVVCDIKLKKPKTVVLIDFPGFNLKLAKKIKKNTSINVVYYISPQVWAWKENRLKYIKQYVDKLIVLFPFEIAWYKKRGINVKYFGHPLVESYQLSKKMGQHKPYDIKRDNFVIALFPGSRQQEINEHLPILKQTVAQLNSVNKKIHYIVRISSNINFEVGRDLGLSENFTIEKNNSFRAFDQASFAVVASGTATLECAVTNTPFVVIYKTSFLSWFITKTFIKVPHASIVNILSNKKIVEEFLQSRAKAVLLAGHLIKQISKGDGGCDFSSLIATLSQKNTYKNTANYIFNFKND